MKHNLYTHTRIKSSISSLTVYGGEKTVSKDQAIGMIIFAACAVIGILYTVGLFYFGEPLVSGWKIEFWLIAIPVFAAFIAIMAIGAWIGWTMTTTPPPKPIEEITNETSQETTKKESSE